MPARHEGYIVVTGTAEKEGKQFVSYCREMGTSSCGDTAEEALGNLEDAIDVHLKALMETGELLRFLQERNIFIHRKPLRDELLVLVPPGKPFVAYQRPVGLAEPV